MLPMIKIEASLQLVQEKVLKELRLTSLDFQTERFFKIPVQLWKRYGVIYDPENLPTPLFTKEGYTEEQEITHTLPQ